jgi:hypothetical protein
VSSICQFLDEPARFGRTESGQRADGGSAADARADSGRAEVGVPSIGTNRLVQKIFGSCVGLKTDAGVERADLGGRACGAIHYAPRVG